MGQTTGEIEAHIQNQRQDLKANLHELEDKFRAAIDWKEYCRNHTGTVLAVAAGLGALVSTRFGGKRRR